MIWLGRVNILYFAPGRIFSPCHCLSQCGGGKRLLATTARGRIFRMWSEYSSYHNHGGSEKWVWAPPIIVVTFQIPPFSTSTMIVEDRIKFCRHCVTMFIFTSCIFRQRQHISKVMKSRRNVLGINIHSRHLVADLEVGSSRPADLEGNLRGGRKYENCREKWSKTKWSLKKY